LGNLACSNLKQRTKNDKPRTRNQEPGIRNQEPGIRNQESGTNTEIGKIENEQKNILQVFAEKVRKIYPNARIWAFGSYARGTAIADSDFDICVVLPELQSDDRFAISDIAWEVSLDHVLHLSTIMIPARDFEHGLVSVSSLIEVVRREGVSVWLKTKTS
jgi:predicted nucleotidyltransferase